MSIAIAVAIVLGIGAVALVISCKIADHFTARDWENEEKLRRWLEQDSERTEAEKKERRLS